MSTTNTKRYDIVSINMDMQINKITQTNVGADYEAYLNNQGIPSSVGADLSASLAFSDTSLNLLMFIIAPIADLSALVGQ